jgi:hypothetical protein
LKSRKFVTEQARDEESIGRREAEHNLEKRSAMKPKAKMKLEEVRKVEGGRCGGGRWKVEGGRWKVEKEGGSRGETR